MRLSFGVEEVSDEVGKMGWWGWDGIPFYVLRCLLVSSDREWMSLSRTLIVWGYYGKPPVSSDSECLSLSGTLIHRPKLCSWQGPRGEASTCAKKMPRILLRRTSSVRVTVIDARLCSGERGAPTGSSDINVLTKLSCFLYLTDSGSPSLGHGSLHGRFLWIISFLVFTKGEANG